MLPSHLDCGFLTGRHDNELRRATVVIGAKAHDADLSHSGRKIARNRGKSKGGRVHARPVFVQLVVSLTDNDEPVVLKVGVQLGGSDETADCVFRRALGSPTETGHRSSPLLYSRLKNAAKTEAGTIEVLCDLDEAEMLLHTAKSFYPEAVPEIEKAIRLVQRVSE
jgi:hypothetical protein